MVPRRHRPERRSSRRARADARGAGRRRGAAPRPRRERARLPASVRLRPEGTGRAADARAALAPVARPEAPVRARRRRSRVEERHCVPLDRWSGSTRTTHVPAPPGGGPVRAGDGPRAAGSAVPGGRARSKPPDRFQVISGFRRVAALRFLQRDQVLARLHADLSDEDALLDGAGRGHPRRAAEPGGAGRRIEARLRARRAAHARRPGHAREGAGPRTTRWRPRRWKRGGNRRRRAGRRRSPSGSGSINQDLRCSPTCSRSSSPRQRAELLQQLRYSAELVAFLDQESPMTAWRWTGTARGCSSC